MPPERWLEKLHDFSLAMKKLEEACGRLEQLNPLEKEGLVHRYEYTFDLAWKAIKDYFKCHDVQTAFPQQTIRKANIDRLISNVDIWLRMIEERNSVHHTHQEEKLEELCRYIRDVYLPSLRYLQEELFRRGEVSGR